jgi:hypothetical protein
MQALRRYECTLEDMSFLRPSEEVVRADVERLAEEIRRAACWTRPIPVERDSGIIMDGNHRWHAARLLRLARVPCFLIDYADPRVRVVHWADGAAFPVARVHATIASGRVLPYKTTRHFFEPGLPGSTWPLATLQRTAVGASTSAASCAGK